MTLRLTKRQRQLCDILQEGLQIAEEPFGFLSGKGLELEEILGIVNGLIEKDVVKRIAAVLDHHRLGFTTNILFVCQVPEEKVEQAGSKLANFGVVSHCYERKTFAGWPYNLFAMMHAMSMGDIPRVIVKFTSVAGVDSFELLPTEAELKKQPVEYEPNFFPGRADSNPSTRQVTR